jgi:hypothetical protein
MAKKNFVNINEKRKAKSKIGTAEVFPFLLFMLLFFSSDFSVDTTLKLSREYLVCDDIDFTVF